MKNKWPYYPDSISEIFTDEEIPILRALLSSLNYRLDIPAIMVDLLGYTMNYYYPDEEEKKYPEFCTYIKSLGEGSGKKECLKSTEKNVRLYRSMNNTNEPLEMKCHMGLTNFVSAINIAGKPVAYCSTGKMCKIDTQHQIIEEINQLKQRISNIGDSESAKLKLLIDVGNPQLKIRSQQDILDFQIKLKQTLSTITKVIEDHFLRTKERNEREFFNRVQNTLSLHSLGNDSDLFEFNNTILKEIRDFLGTEYIAVFSSNENNETVLPIVIYCSSEQQDVVGSLHFNWRKSGLPMDQKEIISWSTSSLTNTELYLKGIKGTKSKMIKNMSHYFPYTLAEGYRGLVILGPFLEKVDINGERVFLNLLCREIGVNITSMTIMNSLQRLDSQRKLMISLTAHRINSILHSVLGEESVLASLVREKWKNENPNDRVEMALTKIEQGVESLKLNAVLTMQTPDAVILDLDRTDIIKRIYSLYVLIGNCVERAREFIIQRGSNIEIEIDSSIERLPSVKIDVWLMEQVFMNLFDNAVKYSAPNKVIKIMGKVEPTYEEVSITIQNLGKGIKKEDLKQIFEIGYRSMSTETTKTVKGAGLGLFIVKKIVDAHKGRISVESRHVSGKEVDVNSWNNISEFTITLPTSMSSNK